MTLTLNPVIFMIYVASLSNCILLLMVIINSIIDSALELLSRDPIRKKKKKTHLILIGYCNHVYILEFGCVNPREKMKIMVI